METLFTQALGLTAPWRVVNVNFQQAAGRIVFQVENTASRLNCPACGAVDQPIHDRLSRTWQHLNFFQYKAVIEAKVPRVGCRACEKTTQVEVPWARPGARKRCQGQFGDPLPPPKLSLGGFNCEVQLPTDEVAQVR